MLFRWLWRFVILVVFLAIVGVGVTGYGYSRLETSRVGSLSIQPAFRVSVGSITSGVFQAIIGNPLGGAVGAVIEGARFTGSAEFANHSFVPLYVPALEHQILVQGEPAGDPFKTESFVLNPGGTEVVPFSFVVPVEDLGALAIQSIVSGGTLSATLETSVGFGSIAVTKTTELSGGVSRPVQQQVTIAPTPTPIPEL